MTSPTISTGSKTPPLNLPTTPFPETEKDALQQAIDSKNTQTILTALMQTKAGDHSVTTRITNTLMKKDNGLDQGAKSALCDHLKQNGVDLHEPILEGKTLVDIANDNQDYGLAKILKETSSTTNRINVVYGTIAGLTTSFLLSPSICIIDKCVTKKQSGKINSYPKGLINETVKLYKQPAQFFRSPYYWSMLAVYGSTYITANVTEAECLNQGKDPLLYKFVLSSIVNIVASNWRDGLYAQLSGKGPARPMPLTGRLLFAMRDSFSVAAGFTIPGYAAKKCEEYGIPKKHAGYASQLGIPVLLQVFIAPMHLLALDLYNHPKSTLKNIWTRIKHEYPKVMGPRILRTLFAYGGGGLTNSWLKEWLSSSEPKKL